MPVRVRALVIALLPLLLLPATSAAQGATVKVAYVDTRELLDKAPGRTEADAQWKKEAQSMQEQVQRMQDSLQQMVTAYQKAEAGLSPAARETRQRSIGDREQEYQTRTQALDLQAQQRQAQLLQPIIDQIKVALEDVRKEEGLTLVLDVGSQANPIVAIDKNLNITDKVLVKLRSMPTPQVAMPTAPRPGAAGEAPAAKPPTAPPAGPVAAPAGAAKPKVPPVN
ncbi:MAG: OmpH family outer membrane protein [Gemmatimonadetes bacterium]|nr:OmpH family outer membrane protein [Gemmatimonadota bacterium]